MGSGLHPKRVLLNLGLVLVSLALVVGWERASFAPVAAPEPAPPVVDRPSPVAPVRSAVAAFSNIHARDYAGPKACGECHEEQYALWRTHPHSRMNQDATPATVLGDFSGVSVDYAGTRATFTRDGDAFFLTVTSQARPRRRYRVTRTIGSRFIQMVAGRQVEGPEPPGDPIYAAEVKLPYGYWLRLKRWLPEGYFDSDTPPEYTDQGALTLSPDDPSQLTSWTRNCVFCHNTYPYALRLRAGPQLVGFPHQDLTLKTPGDRVEALDPAAFVTLGISCESCHFGGREHAEGDGKMRFLPTSPALAFPKGDALTDLRKQPYAINGICAQCHSAKVTCFANGAGTWNSREALDLRASACATQLRCTDCHDPHTPGPPTGPTAVGSAACAKCHADLPRDHSQHDARVTCLDCHMPRIVQGLDGVVRTHRISKPVEAPTLAQAEPNACNLCHLEQSFTWTLTALETGWNRKIPVDPRWPSAAFLKRPAGAMWLRHRTPAVRLVAADAWSRSPNARAAVPRLLGTLNDPYAVNRMFGLFAVERALGRPLTDAEYDPLASPAARRAQIERLELR